MINCFEFWVLGYEELGFRVRVGDRGYRARGVGCMTNLKQVQAENVRSDWSDVVAGPPITDPHDSTLAPTVSTSAIADSCSEVAGLQSLGLASVHDTLCR